MTTTMQKAQKAFDELPEDLKGGDVLTALLWAREMLTKHEGAGHVFSIISDDGEKYMCEFMKPEWQGAHCGQPMDSDWEAVLMAVCEYLNGV